MMMSNDLFVDTSGWAVFLDSDHALHQRAVDLCQRTIRVRGKLLTTNYIINELEALLTNRLHMPRARVLSDIDTLLASPHLTLIHIDPQLHADAWALLKAHQDKTWSLVDAASFIVMRHSGLLEALTTDPLRAGALRPSARAAIESLSAMHKLHLDTDIGGDIDDLCALAMLLRWPDVEITGITTSAEDGGRRAGYLEYVLRLAGRADIPHAAGADVSLGNYRTALDYPPDEVFWPEPIPRRPGPLADALGIVKRGIEAGAVVVATGPYTNLRLLDQAYPGLLGQASLVLMGGYLTPPRPSFPPYTNEDDYNIQWDIESARHVLEHAHPLLVPLSVTVETALRRADIARLRQADAVAQIVARQAAAFTDYLGYGQTCAGLPPDFINFLHDPLACAVALGWDGVTIEELPITIETQDGWLVERMDPTGRLMRVVTAVDADRFNRRWLDVVAGVA